jgi:hypothetical protein
MKKFLIILCSAFIIGAVQNPNNFYLEKEVEMIAVDADHLKDKNNNIYTADRELFIGKTYTVKLEVHPDRTIIDTFEEID